MSKFYFRNLDGIRFIGALLVIVHHIEQNKSMLGIANIWKNPVIQSIGPLGVNLFFTLSGYLITYLLLREYNSNKRIDVRSFYIRRILRIWPLYFLLILLGFLIMPLIVSPEYSVFLMPDYSQRLILFLSFLPNVSYIINGTTPFVHQLWSIGVEEQFYLFWPWLILLSPKKKTAVVVFLAVYILTLVFLNKFEGAGSAIYKIFSHARFSAMAIGGIAGFVMYYKTWAYELIQRKITAWIVFAILIICICFSLYVPYLGYELYSFLFACMIAHLSVASKPVFSLDYPWLNQLGKISYGLYMYHSIMIFASIYLLRLFNLQSVQVLVYAVSIFSTILISQLSYKYFEKYFLNIKEKLAKT